MFISATNDSEKMTLVHTSPCFVDVTSTIFINTSQAKLSGALGRLTTTFRFFFYLELQTTVFGFLQTLAFRNLQNKLEPE